jgi:6-phosphogluconolactonase
LSRHEGGSRVDAKRQDAPHPHYGGFSPDGRFALVPDLGLDGIVIYRVKLEPPAIARHGFAASVRQDPAKSPPREETSRGRPEGPWGGPATRCRRDEPRSCRRGRWQAHA